MTDTKEEIQFNPELIEELRQQRIKAQEKVSEAEKEVAEINTRLFVELQKAPGEAVTVNGWTPRIVRAKRTVYDEEGLKKAIGVVKWNLVTDRKLNTDKLVQEVSVDIISKYAEEVPYGTPHVKVLKAKKEDEVA